MTTGTPAPARILYVEDDPSIQQVGRLSLERVGGFTTRTCGSGAEAVACAPEFRPDLVLLDVMMPDMDGTETLARLRSLAGLEAVPVIFLTAKVQPRERDRLLSLGAIGVVAKPFDPMSLPSEIRAMWAARAGGA